MSRSLISVTCRGFSSFTPWTNKFSRRSTGAKNATCLPSGDNSSADSSGFRKNSRNGICGAASPVTQAPIEMLIVKMKTHLRQFIFGTSKYINIIKE